ncbi:MAG TPA: hypothetical protein HPP87_01600 [Planctomycetes bacterium]|nr:hypothetical protein [Planctomycetota bacterium]HIJ70040.1 hypothetical protein [Planctomycetota bacterium]
MQNNFLEEIVAEWLEYEGYIVKRNERVGRRAVGGHEGELDVVGFNPKTKHLIHVETSTDADSWKVREKRFEKKFSSGDKYIKKLFEGLAIPNQVEKKAIFAIGSDKNHKEIGGGEVVIAEDFILEILHKFKGTSFLSRAVPEKYPILRVLQMISHHHKKVVRELKEE